MKWTEIQTVDLRRMCSDEVPNADIAAYFGVPVTEIHAKRSQLGITIPKIKAAKASVAKEKADTAKPAATPEEGLETFVNGGLACIVLARQGETALIVQPGNRCSPYVVPMQHIPGASDWLQGNYFETLDKAWTHYRKQIGDGEE